MCPGLVGVELGDQRAQAHVGQGLLRGPVGDRFDIVWICDGPAQGAERDVGALWEEQADAGRALDRAAAEGPDARDGAEEGGLAGAGAARDHGGTPGRDGQVGVIQQGAPVRQCEGHVVQDEAVGALVVQEWAQLDAALGQAARGFDGAAEAGQAVDGGAPDGEFGVGCDEPGQRVLDGAEGAGDAGEVAEGDGAGEEAGAGDDEGEDAGELAVAGDQGVDLLLPRHQGADVGDDGGEAGEEAGGFDGLAGVEGDAFGVLADADQGEAEVRLDPLAHELDGGEGAADDVREAGADGGVEDGDPEQVAGDGDAEEGCGAGEDVEDLGEADEGYDLGEELQAEAEGIVGEGFEVFGDALVGVVGCVRTLLLAALLEADGVVGAVGQPVGEQALGHPGAPADLQPLAEVGSVDGDQDVGDGQDGEAGRVGVVGAVAEEEEFLEGDGVLGLDGVEEGTLPGIELDVDGDQDEVHGDDGGEQEAGGPALLGAEVWGGQVPRVAEHGAEAGLDHAASPLMRSRMTPRTSAGGTGRPLRRMSIRPALARAMAACRTAVISDCQRPGSRRRATSLGQMDFAGPRAVVSSRMLAWMMSVAGGVKGVVMRRTLARSAACRNGSAVVVCDLGGAEQAAFAVVAADAGQDGPLRLGLDAGCDDVERLASGQAEQGVEQHRCRRVVRDVADRGRREDEGAERQARHDGDLATSEVAQRDADAEVAQGGEGHERLDPGLVELLVGDGQLQVFGCHPGACEGEGGQRRQGGQWAGYGEADQAGGFLGQAAGEVDRQGCFHFGRHLDRLPG